MNAFPYSIRNMGATDIDSVVDFITLHDQSDGKLARRYYETFFSGCGTTTNRERNFVAVFGGNADVAGVCGLGPDKYDWPGIVWLTWFYVHPAHRRRGVGQLLLDRVLAEAKEFDARKIYLDTSSDEIYGDALAFYAKNEFKEEGRLADYYEPGEDSVILARVL